MERCHVSGFDWNGNDRSYLGDECIDYRIATDVDSGEHKSSTTPPLCYRKLLISCRVHIMVLTEQYTEINSVLE